MTAEQIKATCDSVLANPKWQPRDGTTFCNFGVYWIFHVLGIDLFHDGKRVMTANEICVFLFGSKLFKKIDMPEAIQQAKTGNRLIVAALADKPHGHVAVVYPGMGTIHSGKWKADVPFVANIGAKNGIMGVNYAFAKMPGFFQHEKGTDNDQ